MIDWHRSIFCIWEYSLLTEIQNQWISKVKGCEHPLQKLSPNNMAVIIEHSEDKTVITPGTAAISHLGLYVHCQNVLGSMIYCRASLSRHVSTRHSADTDWAAPVHTLWQLCIFTVVVLRSTVCCCPLHLYLRACDSFHGRLEALYSTRLGTKLGGWAHGGSNPSTAPHRPLGPEQ